MEIKYDFFNKWVDLDRICTLKHPSEIIDGEKINLYLEGTVPALTKDEEKKIKEATRVLWDLTDQNEMYLEIEREFDLNIANLPSKEQAERYIRYLRKRLNLFVEIAEDGLGYNWIQESKTLFRNKYEPFTDEHLELLRSGRYILSPDVIEKADTGIIARYLDVCMRLPEAYKELRHMLDDAEGEITGKTTPPIENENSATESTLSKNTHKLLLLHRLGLFEPLYDKYHQELGIVRFTNLIGTLLGIPQEEHASFKKSLTDFITEGFLRPNSPKTVERPRAVRSVDTYLTSLGLIKTS